LQHAGTDAFQHVLNEGIAFQRVVRVCQRAQTLLSFTLAALVPHLQHARQERVDLSASLVRKATTHLVARWPLALDARAPHCQCANCGSAPAPREAASLSLQLKGAHAQLGRCLEPASRAPALESALVSVLLLRQCACCY
jgi:hypothetical protein